MSTCLHHKRDDEHSETFNRMAEGKVFAGVTSVQWSVEKPRLRSLSWGPGTLLQRKELSQGNAKSRLPTQREEGAHTANSFAPAVPFSLRAPCPS